MTDKKISELAELTGADMQATDQIVVARASTSQNFSMTRQEFLNSSDALLESSLESPSAVRALANRSFATRAAAVTEWAAMVSASYTPPVGTVWTADGLSYRYTGVGTDISDLAGWVPVWPYSTAHFPSVSAARSWSEANEVLIRDETADPNGSQHRIGANLAASENANWLDAAWAVQRTKSTTGTGDHAIAGMLDMTGLSAGQAAGYAGSFMAYNAMDTGGNDVFAAGIRAGAQLYGGTSGTPVVGNVRGVITEISFPLTNQNADTDGRLTGIEVAVKNFGGSDDSEVENPTATCKRNILFAQGGDDSPTEHQPNTALTMCGNNGPGWHYGHTVRNILKDYLYLFDPAASGARAVNVRPSASWAESLIAIPEDHGIGVWDTAGTTLTTAMTGDSTTAGALNFPVGVKLGGGSDLLDTYEEGTFTPVLSDGTNNATQSAQQGFYTRIGRVVIGFLRVVCSDVSSLSGNLRITGLPFTSESGLNNKGGGHMITASGLSLSAASSVMLQIGPAVGYGLLKVSDTAGGGSSLTSAEVSNSTILEINFQYRA